MRILHTESSLGWGGQEMRILAEAKGMRERGHTVIMALHRKGRLAKEAKVAGIEVYELAMQASGLASTFLKLVAILRRERIDIVNTHSSFDAHVAGLAAKLMGIAIVRTRHLSTPIRKGFNSLFLYNFLADRVVTTCHEVALKVEKQARLRKGRCLSIPTGVDPRSMQFDEKEREAFRKSLGLKAKDLVIGTLCILRGWKGIADFLHAAHLLKDEKDLRWIIVGSGSSEESFLALRDRLGLQESVHFTGFLNQPAYALASLDIFCLLSHAHEGVSQAALQAAWLGKPLITTATGGLKETTLHKKNGFIVNAHQPEEVASAIRELKEKPLLRAAMARKSFEHARATFTHEKMLDGIEKLLFQLKS